MKGEFAFRHYEFQSLAYKLGEIFVLTDTQTRTVFTNHFKDRS